jgi:hypothetical protein
VRFERVESDPELVRLRLRTDPPLEAPSLTVRVHRPASGVDGLGSTYTDIDWTDGGERLVMVPPAREASS